MAFCQFAGLFPGSLVRTCGNDEKTFVLHPDRVVGCLAEITLGSATAW